MVYLDTTTVVFCLLFMIPVGFACFFLGKHVENKGWHEVLNELFSDDIARLHSKSEMLDYLTNNHVNTLVVYNDFVQTPEEFINTKLSDSKIAVRLIKDGDLAGLIAIKVNDDQFRIIDETSFYESFNDGNHHQNHNKLQN